MYHSEFSEEKILIVCQMSMQHVKTHEKTSALLKFRGRKSNLIQGKRTKPWHFTGRGFSTRRVRVL